jgi:23S rRNA (adenine2503-C2)-methyltransferase
VTNLVGQPLDVLRAELAPVVGAAYRVNQVISWIVDRRATTFAEMTDLSKEVRRRLADRFVLEDPTPLQVVVAVDGCQKLLLGLGDGATVEAVVMPSGRKTTFCLSSQTGCALGCTFCVTGRFGAGRNLTSAEMVGQYRVMLRTASQEPERVNLVFMGMGEPLLNTEHLGRALGVLSHTVSPRRITVSTAGVIPGIRWLAGLERRPKLAVSLNAPDQARRERLMPIARRYPLDELLDELRRFPLERGRRLTFEYVMIHRFNDDPADARALAALLRPLAAKVNLIPLNVDSAFALDFRPSPPDRVRTFVEALHSHGLTATVRASRGQDVAAACGQLKGSVGG